MVWLKSVYVDTRLFELCCGVREGKEALLTERTRNTRNTTDAARLVDATLDGTLERWPDEPPRPPRTPIDKTRLALIDTPGQVHRLSPKFSDVGRAAKIAAAFRRAKPSKLSPTATGTFDARAYYDPDTRRWRIAARYLPDDHSPDHPVTAAPTRRPGTVASRRSELAAVTAAVRAFKTTNGRTPTFDETCALMGWTPHHTRQVLAATKPAEPTPSAPPPPPPSSSTATGPSPTGPATNAVGRPLSPEPLVPGPIPLPPPDSPDARARRRAWRWLTTHHQIPTERAVTARVQTAAAARAGAARRRARSLEQAATATAIAAADGPRARHWIADYRATHHQGPLWRELAEAMGWTSLASKTRQRLMTILAADGYLTYHPDMTRSLNTGPGRPT